MSTPGDLEDPVATLQARIGYTFRDANLLRLALTHSSLAFEQGEAAGRRHGH